MQLAKAEVSSNSSATRAMKDLALVRENDAEKGVHRILRRAQLSCPVDVEKVDLGEGKLRAFPMILLSSWVQYLLDTKSLWRQFTGVRSLPKMQAVLEEFWHRYRVIWPNHPVFALADSNNLNLSCSIPFYSHTDEGRSMKHLAFWILSCAGAIGRGTSLFVEAGRQRARLADNGMGLNFLGGTFSTQFIIGCMLKTLSNQSPDAIDRMIELFTADVVKLMHEGFKAKDASIHCWMIPIGAKGDLPALVKLGKMTRSFSHVPRGCSTRKPSKGICHLCLAGQERDEANGLPHIPYEDVSEEPAWGPTMLRHVAWNSEPPVLHGLGFDVEGQHAFFCTDIWHNSHMGVFKAWVGSGLVAAIESDEILEGGSTEAKFESLNKIYQEWVQNRGKTPLVSEITRDTLCFPASTAVPTGKWAKAAASTQMLLFMDEFFRTHVQGRTGDALLLSVAPGTYTVAFE